MPSIVTSTSKKIALRAAQLVDTTLDKSIVFSFDQTGYYRHRHSFGPADTNVDMRGKVCLITGANAGIGLATARALAERGATVLLLCRNPDRARKARAELIAQTGNHNIYDEIVDMADMASITALVQRLSIQCVDVLVHNAAVMPDRRIETRQGHELTWATNVLGPFLLTQMLVPHLRTAQRARVINVSSGGMYTQRLELDDVGWQKRTFDGMVAYAQSKRVGIILSELWAEHLQEHGIAVNSMHPGWVDTASVRTSMPRFYSLMRSRLRRPEEGADTVVWLAVCQRIAAESGKFWFDRAEQATHLLARTVETEEERMNAWNKCVDDCRDVIAGGTVL